MRRTTLSLRLSLLRQRFTRRTIVSLVVALLLLVVGSLIAVSGFNAPESKEREVTRLSYEIKGGFDHEAYGQSTKAARQPNPKYFPKIIDSIVVSYSYKFLSEEPVSQVTEQVEISAVVKSPGMWAKEITLVPLTEKKGDFSLSFPLNTTEFLELADAISEDIGVSRSSPDVILKATVHTEVETQSGVLTDDFVQTCQVDLTEKVIEWHRPLDLSKKGYWQGLIYEHQGNFGYAIQLKPNILFGETIINSDIPAVEPIEKLARSPSYLADTTETIEVTLSYQLDSDQPLNRVESEVAVSAVLSKPGGEQMFFELVPKSRQAENFTVTFPLDVVLFYDIIEAAEGESSTPSYELVVQTDVHTVAQSEFGVIDEVLSPNLTVTLESDRLLWPEPTEETKSGSFKEMVVVANTGRTTTIVGSLGVFGMMIAALLYAIWSYSQAKPIRVPPLEAEAIRAKRKHKDTIVDVRELPPAKAGEVVMPLYSLDELVKVADALLKPVLHQAEAEQHTYCVNDGTVRYQYVSEILALVGDKSLVQQLEEVIIEEAERRQRSKRD